MRNYIHHENFYVHGIYTYIGMYIRTYKYQWDMGSLYYFFFHTVALCLDLRTNTKLEIFVRQQSNYIDSFRASDPSKILYSVQIIIDKRILCR